MSKTGKLKQSTVGTDVVEKGMGLRQLLQLGALRWQDFPDNPALPRAILSPLFHHGSIGARPSSLCLHFPGRQGSAYLRSPLHHLPVSPPATPCPYLGSCPWREGGSCSRAAPSLALWASPLPVVGGPASTVTLGGCPCAHV